MARTLTNLAFSMEHEMVVYSQLAPDLETLRVHADQLVLAGGDESREKNLPAYRPNPWPMAAARLRPADLLLATVGA